MIGMILIQQGTLNGLRTEFTFHMSACIKQLPFAYVTRCGAAIDVIW